MIMPLIYPMMIFAEALAFAPEDLEQLKGAVMEVEAGTTPGSYGGVDISEWDTSRVTSFEGLFKYGTLNHDLSKWNTSAVTSFAYLFDSHFTFNRDLNKWDTSRVTTMWKTFYRAWKFNGDISSWDVSKVESMGRMFHSCGGGICQGQNEPKYCDFDRDISKWNTQNVKNMDQLLGGCRYFNTTLLTFWNMTSVEEEYSLQWPCPLGLPDSDMSSGTAKERCGESFEDFCSNASYVKQVCGPRGIGCLSGYFNSASEAINDEPVTCRCPRGYSGPQCNVFRPHTVMELREAVVDWCDSNTKVAPNIEDWSIELLDGLDGVFRGFTSCDNGFNISSWDVSKIETLEGTFENNAVFNEYIAHWNVDRVKNFKDTFTGARSFEMEQTALWYTGSTMSKDFELQGQPCPSGFIKSKDWGSAIERCPCILGYEWDPAFDVCRAFDVIDDCNINNGDRECSGRGMCVTTLDLTRNTNNRTCTCDRGFRGNTCETKWNVVDLCEGLDGKECSGHGTCTTTLGLAEETSNKSCTSCNRGYGGSTCEIEWTVADYCAGRGGQECSGQGTCTKTLGFTQETTNQSCTSCNRGYRGATCEVFFPQDPSQLRGAVKEWCKPDTNPKVYPIGGWNLTDIQVLDYAFAGIVACAKPLDIGTWDVSRITSLEGTFFGSSFNEDIGNWTVDNVVTMKGMFARNEAFNQDLSLWKTGQVELMAGMFDGATGMTYRLEEWNRDAVVDCTGGCADACTPPVACLVEEPLLGATTTALLAGGGGVVIVLIIVAAFVCCRKQRSWSRLENNSLIPAQDTELTTQSTLGNGSTAAQDVDAQSAEHDYADVPTRNGDYDTLPRVRGYDSIAIIDKERSEEVGNLEYTNVEHSKSEPIPNDNDGNKSVSDDDSDDSTDGTVDALAQN